MLNRWIRKSWKTSLMIGVLVMVIAKKVSVGTEINSEAVEVSFARWERIVLRSVGEMVKVKQGVRSPWLLAGVGVDGSSRDHIICDEWVPLRKRFHWDQAVRESRHGRESLRSNLASCCGRRQSLLCWGWLGYFTLTQCNYIERIGTVR